MAEAILLELGKFVLDKLGSLAVDELKMLWGAEDEIKRITSNMTRIQAVLRDAEKHQSISEADKDWLGKLRDVTYDIGDLIDDITTEIAIQGKNEGQWLKQVRKFFSTANPLVLRTQWVHQMKELSNKLCLIAEEKKNYQVSPECANSDSPESRSRETCSTVNQSSILGRNGDKEVIIKSILNCGDSKSLSVIPIFGLGAIGKTTLAQLVYNDPEIDKEFDQKLWVYVSKEYSMMKVLKKVISVATGRNMEEERVLEVLSGTTKKVLKDKKYFLVLDDLWNENVEEWQSLRDLLDVGAKGSTAVVTTRHKNVASIVQTVGQYELTELSQDTWLQIFKRLAFEDGHEKISSTFSKLADEIFQKSMGLPLLATTLGNLLRGQKDERKWKKVIQELEQGKQDKILNVLKLSYDVLPSNMKPCFCIFSIYGKGAAISPLVEMLPLWMALGFVPNDDVGSHCVEELLSKSIFTQGQGEDVVPDCMFPRVRMHDFFYDLANNLLNGEEELAIINSSTKEVCKKVRYLALDVDSSGKQCHERLLKKAKKARLLKIKEQSLSKAFLQFIISNFELLRVLDLKDCQFDKLPGKIGNMRHLRYLDLVGNERIKQLPNSICNLINLQSLSLIGCTSLQELPADIGRLENLKYLGVTTQQNALPEGMRQFKGLRTLILVDCPRLAFLPTKLLEKLDTLLIVHCQELDLAHESWSLGGQTSLRILLICGLPKLQKLPMGDPFSSLHHLVVDYCHGLTELGDGIEYLTSLKTLALHDNPSLVGLPITVGGLGMLEKLIIRDCPRITEKCAPENGDAWHLISHISHIQIDNQTIVKDASKGSK